MQNDMSEKSIHKIQKDIIEPLELPSMRPISLIRKFGPGIMLMMTGIGTSHLVTAPVAGGRYGYALLWCLPIAYIFKYYGFEMAIRFTHATGRSILDAYATAWKKIPIWYVLITTIIQSAVGQAGRLIAAAAVIFYFFRIYLQIDIPLFDDNNELALYALILGLISVYIILRGNYKIVELTTKIAAGILIVSIITIYAFEPAPTNEFVHFFQIDTPEGSWLIIASFLGLLPTGIDVSLQASEWGKAKNVGTSYLRKKLEQKSLIKEFDPFSSTKQDLQINRKLLSDNENEYCSRWFRIGLIDFRLGHIVSFILAAIFILLAAVWLFPSSVSGNAVMGEIARIFTDSVGTNFMVIFLAGALAATFSTAFNYFDGWPRVIGACCRNLFKKTAALPRDNKSNINNNKIKYWYSEYNLYRISMFFSLIMSVGIIAGLPRPVYLVLIASALAYFVAPIIYFLNLFYCITIIPKEDQEFFPSKFAIFFGSLSLVVFTGMSLILILQRIFGINLNL